MPPTHTSLREIRRRDDRRDQMTAVRSGDVDAIVRERPMSVKRIAWEYVHHVLQENGGNISATARALSIDRRTLQRKLRKRPVAD